VGGGGGGGVEPAVGGKGGLGVSGGVEGGGGDFYHSVLHTHTQGRTRSI